MPYTIYTNHPESQDRKAEDFTSWSFWAAQHAPWAGVSVSEMAKLVGEICDHPDLQAACEKLDQGGVLELWEALAVYQQAASMMGDRTRDVFRTATSSGYGVRVVFSRSFSSPSAAEYLANSGSF
jgi:hypothetical protein